MYKRVILAALFSLSSHMVVAGVPRDLPYPKGEPSAEEVARQVYYANHFYAFKNFMIRRVGRTMTIVINHASSGKTTNIAVERYLNNDYDDGIVKARDMAFFRSGRLKGTGLLVTDFVDDNRNQSYVIWLPALRKVRRFAQPAHDDTWGGTVFTFGDVTLRKPRDETHELLGKQAFDGCLGSIKKYQGKRYRYVGLLPSGSCRHKGKEVYLLKSTTKFQNWWYDYRISFVDTKSFADYRTVYYKGDTLVKVIDRDWGLVTGSGSDDPRALFWKYWYGRDMETGNETWAVIPQKVIEFDADKRSSFWSEATLRKLKR